MAANLISKRKLKETEKGIRITVEALQELLFRAIEKWIYNGINHDTGET